MRRILSLICVAVAALAMVACGDDDHYRHGAQGGYPDGGDRPSGELNEYEQRLVGSYVSDDDPSNPFSLVLYDDRTGYYLSVSDGMTTGDDFTWSATSSTLAVVYGSDGSRAVMDYYYSDDGHLYVDGIPLVVNADGTPSDSVSGIVGQWKGTISGYYSAMFGIADDSCATICEFAANGEGTQLDFMVSTPLADYAYSPFTWSETGGVIVVNYVDDALPRAIYSDYALSDTGFTGTVIYGAQSFGFAYDATSGFDWTPYITGEGLQEAKSRIRRLPRATPAAVRCGAFAR